MNRIKDDIDNLLGSGGRSVVLESLVSSLIYAVQMDNSLTVEQVLRGTNLELILIMRGDYEKNKISREQYEEFRRVTGI